MMKKGILILAALTQLMISCNYDEKVEVVCLGAREKTVLLSMSAAIDTISLVTNVPYEMYVVAGGEWLELAAEGLIPSYRKEMPFTVSDNSGYPRMAKVLLRASGRTDTVYVRQDGPLVDRVSVLDKTCTMGAAGGSFSTEVECLRYPDGVMVEVSLPKAVSSAVCAGGRLDVEVAPNLSRDSRVFTVKVYYMDDWNVQAYDTVTISQSGK